MYVKFVSSLIITGKSKLFNIYQLFNDYRFKVKIFLTLFVLSVSCLVEWCYMLTGNGFGLGEGGDFEALHCQPSRNFDRSTKLDLTTKPPLLGRCCYELGFYIVFALSMVFSTLSMSEISFMSCQWQANSDLLLLLKNIA